MKKVFYFVACAYMVALGMVGCSKNTAAPKILFGDGSLATAVVSAGSSLDVTVHITADARLKGVKFFTRHLNGDTVPYGCPTSTSNNAKSYECTVTLRDVVEDLTLIVQATDRKNRTVTAEYTVTVKREPNAAATFVTKTLGFNKLNSVGSSYSVSRSAVMLLSEANAAQAEVDFMVFFGKENGITLAAPSNEVVTRVFNNLVYGTQTWGTRNETQLVKVNLDFATASPGDITNALSNSMSTIANHLQGGDVVAFQTSSGQVGLIQLSNVGIDAASTVDVSVRVI